MRNTTANNAHPGPATRQPAAECRVCVAGSLPAEAAAKVLLMACGQVCSQACRCVRRRMSTSFHVADEIASCGQNAELEREAVKIKT